MRKFLFCLLLFFNFFLYGFNLKTKCLESQAGDYIVLEQKGLISVLFVRQVSYPFLVLEEVDAPLKLIPEKISWKSWIKEEAPGHTAWITYLIDLEKGEVQKMYSYLKSSFLPLNQSFHVFTRLLNLPLNPVALDERKKIGPQPFEGEFDRRSLWTPLVRFEGKKIDKSLLSVWNTHWFKDDSVLSQSEIQLYCSSFFFPHWIDIQTEHYTLTIRSLDSGKNMTSPKKNIFINSLNSAQSLSLNGESYQQ